MSRCCFPNLHQVEQLLGTNHFILLLLPPLGEHLDATAVNHVKEIERMLLDRQSTAAVAVARETVDTAALLKRLNIDGEERRHNRTETSISRCRRAKINGRFHYVFISEKH